MPYDSAFGQMMNSVFGSFDMAIFSGFAFVQNDIFTFLAKVFTTFGEFQFVIMYLFLSCALLLFKRTRKIGALIIAVVAVFVLVNDLILKDHLLRLRPYNALQGNSEYFNWYMNVGAIAESPYCFPSGHSCSTFAVATVLFFWIKKDLKKTGAGFIFIIPIFVALSRIYLMLHYPTDVIAGSIEGILIGILVWYVAKFCINNANLVPNKIRQKNSIDLEPWLEKRVKHKLEPKNVALVVVLLLICFGITAFTKFNIQSEHPQRCEHHGPDYICMNEGKYQSYNEDEGQFHFYCKEHRGELEK